MLTIMFRMASNLSGIYGNYDAVKIGEEWGLLRQDDIFPQGGIGYSWMSFSPVNKDGQLGELDGTLIPYQLATGRADFDALGQLSLGFFAIEGISIGARGLIGMGGRHVTNQSSRNFMSHMIQNELRAYTYTQSIGVRSLMKGKGVDAAFRYYANKNIILNSAAKLRLINIGSRTFGPDMVGRGLLRRYWWDVTTLKSWSIHSIKYTPNYGLGTGFFY